MNVEAIALGRDVALILLIFEAVILAVPLLVVPFYVIRYLPRVKAPVRPSLRKVRLRTQQVEQVTKTVMGVAIQPFIWTGGAVQGLRRALEYLATRR